MGETGKNIVDGFRTLRKFCNEVSIMLKTADGMMEDANWMPISNKTLDTTSVISNPDWWMPYELFRYYQHDEFPHLLPYIAINLDDPLKDENDIVINEALVSAGMIDYGSGNNYQDFEYWFCRAHLFMEDREDNGKLFFIDNPHQEWEDKEWVGAIKVTTFAHPLDTITNSDILKSKIVQPLIDAIQRSIGISEKKIA